MKQEVLLARYNFLIPLIKQAGDIALNYFKNYKNLTIEIKSIQNIVSIADKQVEQFIIEEIKKNFPSDAILGEESGLSSKSSAIYQTAIWIIDPIDGTMPFLCGLPHWCVSIAFVFNNKIIFGAVYDPLRDELFQAFLNEGSFLNNVQLKISEPAKIDLGMIGAGYSSSTDIGLQLKFIENLLVKNGSYYRNGSGAIMICYCAAERLIGYVESQINSWDVAAAIIICSEAGLSVSNFVNDNWLDAPGPILVANKSIYLQLQEIIPWQI